MKVYHSLNLTLLAAAPAAFVFDGPSALRFPIDVYLGVAFPVHAHIGMNCVISDYGKKFFGAGAVVPLRTGLLGVTAVTTVGLLKLNLMGPGLTATIKRLWKSPTE